MSLYHKHLVQDRLWAVLAFLTTPKLWLAIIGLWVLGAATLLIWDQFYAYPV